MANKGTKLWEVAPNPLGGRPLKFKSPDKLWKKFLAYCQWVDDNPWEEKNASNSIHGSKGESSNSMQQYVRVYQRAYTLYGFSVYAGIYNWTGFKKTYMEKDGFPTIIHAIEESIKAQQVDGAVLNRFNSNLVARLNGIADTTKTEVTGKDGSDLFEKKIPKLSDDDLRKISEINAQL